MKKVRISFAALVLVLAIAGTATANAKSEEAEPCSEADPDGTVCLSENQTPCCEDEIGNTYYNRNKVEVK